MFDINHISKIDNVNSKVKDKLNKMKLLIEYDSSINRIGECVKSELSGYVQNLKNILIEFEHNSHNLSYIMVNNELMKSMMLLNESNNEHLKKKTINSLSKDYLKEVKSNQYEVISSTIDEIHVKLMSNVCLLSSVFCTNTSYY